MRAIAWGMALATSLALLAGVHALGRTAAGSPPTTTASRQALPVSVADVLLPSGAPLASPSPTPTPTPVVHTPPASAPAVYAPVRPPAPPQLVVRTTQQALINQDRAAYGLAPLTWNSCLYNVALSNARRMAAQEYISHTNGVYSDLACGVGGRSGENVGYWSAGISDGAINNLFMASPDHKANILGPYRYVATAWVIGANGYGYIAVEFD